MKRDVHFLLLGLVALGLVWGAGSLNAYAKKTEDPSFPKDWQVCKIDTDCVVVTGVCGNWDCVNNSAKDELDKVNRKMEQRYGCSVSAVTPQPQPKAVCKPKGCRCESPALKKTGW